MSSPLSWCERCGKYFTTTGTTIAKAATGRGPVFDIPDSVCPSCMKPDEIEVNGAIWKASEWAALNQTE